MARFNLPPVPDLRAGYVTDSQMRGAVEQWMEDTRELLQEALNDLAGEQLREPVRLPRATVAELTTGSPPKLRAGADARLAYCTDDTDGAVPAFSDGTTWRRVTDRAEVTT